MADQPACPEQFCPIVGCPFNAAPAPDVPAVGDCPRPAPAFVRLRFKSQVGASA